jgi:hypothetical protein
MRSYVGDWALNVDTSGQPSYNYGRTTATDRITGDTGGTQRPPDRSDRNRFRWSHNIFPKCQFLTCADPSDQKVTDGWPLPTAVPRSWKTNIFTIDQEGHVIDMHCETQHTTWDGGRVLVVGLDDSTALRESATTSTAVIPATPCSLSENRGKDFVTDPSTF